MKLIPDPQEPSYPFNGGLYLSNWPWDVTFGATGQNMLYVPPGYYEWTLPVSYDVSKAGPGDYNFAYARYGPGEILADIIWVVPEPSTVLLLLSGLVGLLLWRRRAA